MCLLFFFFKQKTAYEMRISDWSSDVCSSDLFQRATWGLNQWTAIVAVLGFARRLAPGDSPALRYLTAAVFPIYILHQTAIVVFAHNLKPLTIAPIVEGPLLALDRKSVV